MKSRTYLRVGMGFLSIFCGLLMHGKVFGYDITDKFSTALPYKGIQWSLEKEKYFGRAEQRGLLHKFLDSEKESVERSGFIPSYFEFRFGSLKTGQYFQINTEQGDIRLYGIIDRIDVHPNGQFMVIDYKTGSAFKNINLNQIIEGNSLQLPVYLAAAGNYFEQKGQSLKPVAGIYYQVKDAENCRQMIVFADSEQSPPIPLDKKVQLPQPVAGREENISFFELITQSLRYVAEYVNQIGSGNFRHTRHPMDDRCKTYCLYSKICRKDPTKLLSIADN